MRLSDKDDFQQTENRLQALLSTSAGRALMDTAAGLFDTAVAKTVELAKEHGPELVEALLEGAAKAAVSKGLEKLTQ